MTAATTPATDKEKPANRAAFEKWLMDVHGLDSLWNEQRNCFDDWPAHLAFKAWQAGSEQAIRECAEKCREQQSAFLSPEYATGQPLSSFSERFACSECEREILSLIEGRQP